MSLFTRDDETRIAKAIADAEVKTSGEIVAVVAPESSTYLYAPVLWAALVALFVPWPFIQFTWVTMQVVHLIQIVVFAVLALLLLLRPLRYWLVPRSVKRARAHSRAVEQFLVQNLHTTATRTGVLVFVSLAEQYAEIIADAGIHKKVTPTEWQTIVDMLTAEIGAGQPAEGFIKAIGAIGGHLTRHFPAGTPKEQVLPNHLIVLGGG